MKKTRNGWLSVLFAACVSCLWLPMVAQKPVDDGSRMAEKERRAALKAGRQNMPTVAPARVAANAPTLYGYVYDSYGPYWGAAGIYSINPKDANDFNCVAEGVNAYGGGTYGSGTYYALDYVEKGSLITFPATLTLYDVSDWSQKKLYYSTTKFENLGADITFDPTTGNLYGVFYDSEYTTCNVFGTIRLGSPNEYSYEVEQIGGNLPERMVAIACNAQGQLYCFGVSGSLYAIDKTSGGTSLIGSTGVDVVPWKQSACCDMTTGTIYWTSMHDYGDNNQDFGLFEVNPTTAEAELIGNYGYTGTFNSDCICGLTTFQNVEVSSAPLPPSDLYVDFDGASLSATVTFTMPSTDTGGSSLSGTVDYELYVDGTVQSSGSAQAGSVVEVTAGVAADGMHEFSVLASRGGSASTPVSCSAWAGNDTPCAPKAVNATRGASGAGGTTVYVSWQAVTEGIHGGYVDQTGMSYSVVRMPDGKTVYTGSSTTCSDLVESAVKTVYTYEVTATSAGLEGDKGRSAGLDLGEYLGVPYTQDFNDDDSFDDWTVFDNNNDGSTWVHGGGRISYKYNTKNAADDYAFTPGIWLESGNLYHFEFTAYNTSLVEKVAAYVGKSAVASAMTTELVPPTDITYEPRMHNMRGSFKPTQSGMYYFAVKACSDADMSTLYVDDVRISVTPADAPDKPRNLNVWPGAQGALSAKVKFSAPSVNVAGNTLESIDYCVVERDGQEIARVTDITPGQSVIVNDDSGVSQDTHIYKVYAVSSGLVGDYATASKYIGLDSPGPVRNLRASEDLDNPGTVVLTWDAPDTGQHGGYVNPDELVYVVSVGYDDNEYSTTEKRFEDHLDISSGQAYQGYSVYAVNSAGSGRYVWKTVVGLAGPAYDAPVYESLSGVRMNITPWLPDIINGEIGQAYWTPCDGSYLESGAQDADGGVFSFNARMLGAASRLSSPKVDISKLESPQVSYWVYLTGKSDRLDVQLSADHGEWQTLRSIALNSDTKGWHRFTEDLSDYRGSQFVRVSFAGYSVETLEQITAFDNVAITEASDCDLNTVALTGPEKIRSGETGEFTLSLRNSGNMPVSGADYTIELLLDGEVRSECAGVDVDVDMTTTVTLTDVPSVADPEMSVYSARIKCDSDQNMSNNESGTVTVEIVMPLYPRVSGLTGESEYKKIKLYWDEPDFSDMPAQSVTERFESYESFIINGIGDWKTVDRDGQKTIKLTIDASFGPLEYPNTGEPMAFQVFNSEEAGIPFSTWDAHSGSQMLVAFKCASPDGGVTETPNDDWLISPELNGEAQTISFYAKTGMGGVYTPESFEVLYSTTTPTVEAFTRIGDTQHISNYADWEEFKVQLPEGARYFAIRCVSDSKFAFMLDDITYIPAGAVAEEISLMGYNVYRDKHKMNDEPLPETLWKDKDITAGETYTYQVSAVYDKGESRLSDPVTVVATAINPVTSLGMQVCTAKGMVMLKGADGLKVEIYSADGACVFSTENVAGLCRVNTGRGIYVVRVDGKAFTVSVP